MKENTAGIYYDRVKVLYQKQYGHEINDDKIANMKSIRIEQYGIIYSLYCNVKLK